MEKIQIFLLWILPFVFSLSVHESAHAWMANRLGDPTARLLGRMTLNPMAHMDPIGTLFLPMLAFFTGAPMIGWAKPVPIQERNLKNPLQHGMLVALAGPASNFILAIFFTLAFILFRPSQMDSMAIQSGFMIKEPLFLMARIGIQLNLILGFFNLLPLPPLDGSRILQGLFPHLQETLSYLERYSFLILILLLMSGILRYLVFYPSNFVFQILTHMAL